MKESARDAGRASTNDENLWDIVKKIPLAAIDDTAEVPYMTCSSPRLCERRPWRRPAARFERVPSNKRNTIHAHQYNRLCTTLAGSPRLGGGGRGVGLP